MLTASTLQEDFAIITQILDVTHVLILEIELGQPLPMLSAINEKTGQHYQHARCLVRLHDHPLGLVELQFDKNELYAHDYVQHIWHLLSGQINEHLRQDCLPPVTELDEDGL